VTVAFDPQLYEEIKQGVVGVLQNLGLQGMESTSIVSQYDVDMANASTPGIQCISAGLTDQAQAGDTEMRQYMWPVGLMIVDNPGSKTWNLEGLYLGWRKQIYDAFHMQNPLSEISGVAGCTVSPRVIFDPRNERYAAVQSSLLVWVEACGPRS
jgi:hypothetical protein